MKLSGARDKRYLLDISAWKFTPLQVFERDRQTFGWMDTPLSAPEHITMETRGEE